MISISTQSASCNHPAEMETTTDPVRLLEDLADAMGNKEHHPDEPTKLPNKPEGTGWHGNEQSAEGVQSRVSIEGTESPGEVGDDENWPGKFKKPLNEPQVEFQGPTGVQVEPGGETTVKPDGSTMHEDMDATTNNRAEEAHRDMQDEVEKLVTCWNTLIEGERSATVHAQPTTAVKESDQHTLRDDENVPGPSPEPPPLVLIPYKPAQWQNESPRVELEGESKSIASFNNALTNSDMHMLGASRHEKDAREKPTNLPDMLGCEQEHSKQRTQENSPRRAWEELEDLGCEVDVSVTSEGDQDAHNWPKVVQDTLAHVGECSKKRSQNDSPEEPKLSHMIWETKWMHHQHWAMSRTSGNGRRSCAKHQNMLGNAQKEKAETTHLVDIKRSQMCWAAKRPYQVVSTTSRNALEMSETSTLMKWTHHIRIGYQEVIGTYRRHWEPLRLIGTTWRLLKVLDTMGKDPRASGMCVTLIWTLLRLNTPNIT